MELRFDTELGNEYKYPANIIIHVPRQQTRPTKLTANINPREHGFVSKTQTLLPANINEFTVLIVCPCYNHSLAITFPFKISVANSVHIPELLKLEFLARLFRDHLSK